MCFNAFAHISRPPETFLKKIFFWPSGVLKNVFWCICAYFQTTRIFFFKKYILYRLEWLKPCFDAFAHTSIPLETFFRKRYFLPSGVVRNVFCAYLRPPETFFQKRYFLPAGVVKDGFWCIFAYFQTTRNTRNFFSKKIFLNVWSG